jgi:hypothetical protein
MKNIVIATTFSFALGLSALAQTTSSTQEPSTQPQTSPSHSRDMSDNSARGEKKMKGCIKSEGGKYMLEEKHGKESALTGSQDFASHLGHTVAVHGTWNSGSDMSSSNSSMSASGSQFLVSKLDMISDSCKMDKESSSPDNTSGKPSPNRK